MKRNGRTELKRTLSKEVFQKGNRDCDGRGSPHRLPGQKIADLQQKAIEVASKAIAMKLPVDQISEMTGLSLEKIQELQGKSVSKI